MRSLGAVAALLGMVFIFAVACGEQATAAQTHTLDVEDDGTTVAVAVGDTVLVQLEGNPTTGFLWEVKDTLVKDILEPVGEGEYEVAKTEKPLVGVGGVFTFEFKAVGAGTTPLELIYQQPWMEGKGESETFAVTVVVGD